MKKNDPFASLLLYLYFPHFSPFLLFHLMSCQALNGQFSPTTHPGGPSVTNQTAKMENITFSPQNA